MADVECPVCGKLCKSSQINTHVNSCLNASETPERPKRGNSDSEEKVETNCQPSKRQKTGAEEKGDRSPSHRRSVSESEDQKGGRSSLTKAWSFLKSPTGAQKNKNSKNANLETVKDSSKAVDCSSGESGSLDTELKSKPLLSTDTVTVTDPDNIPKESADSNGLKTTGMQKGFLKSKTVLIEQKKMAQTSTTTKSTFPSPKVGTNIPENRLTRQKNQDGIPLPERMRPKTLTDYMGQNKVIGKNKLLRTLLESDRIPSMILWGPPGCGKTTLARIIAARCKETHNTKFVTLSATTAGVADVKEIVKIAKNDLKMFHRKTILFVDEIHRFNKLQQDTFLPHVEVGTISLIGATTENPSFQVNNALMSRCRVITLEKLSVEDLQNILQKALDHLGVTVVKEKEDIILNNESIGGIEEDAVLMLANLCDGDARAALNCLQIAVDSCILSSDSNKPMIASEHIKETLQRSHVQYDRTGEEHYNCASAFQKSIRGSNDNGAIYWLSRMLEGGEDPRFIARRLVVTASEDIGLADPQALPLAMATFQACTMIGMPECAINLAHCTTYLARAPKSNESYQAMSKARDMIRNHEGALPGVPLHLRNAPTKLLKDMGCGKNYKYSHNHPGDTAQEYLPEELRNVNFFKESTKKHK